MNVLIITAMFPPIRTGTSFYSQNLATALHKRGHKVTVVTVKNKDTEQSDYPFEVERIKAFHINLRNFFKHLRFSSIFPSNYNNIKKIAIRENADKIILVNHYLDIAFPAIYVSRKLKLPLYISVGTQMQSLNPFRNSILRFLDRWICGELIFPHCKSIVSWDSEIERYINEIQPEKIAKKSVIIPFGANGNIESLEKYEPTYRYKGRIIGVGAIISQRDYLFNIKVFYELLKKRPDLKLTIIGHNYIDSAKGLVQELNIENSVEFLGEVPHDKVIEEMKNSDIHWMMLSARYVGLGTATLEAMLLGIPSISNSPENLFGENTLKDLENYIHTDGLDIGKTVSKIDQILSDDELRKKIGLHGKKFVTQHLNWDQVAIGFEELMNKN